MLLRPIALNCLAHPSALALDPSEQVLYVCETLRNRVLKVYVGENGRNLVTVFHQFSGKLGPSAISVSRDGLVFVARFEQASGFSRFVKRWRDCRVGPYWRGYWRASAAGLPAD